jgi:hypothetical protein
MHPGWADTAGVRNWMPLFRALTRPVIRTPEQGADISCGDGPRAFPTMILRTAIAYTWSS